ncbi:MAG: hypothetical protein JRJ87_23005 [Deltaproteobacteria bacterium]|nr:hypothetical protein [Deltaproteobacteria bacterium]
MEPKKNSPLGRYKQPEIVSKKIEFMVTTNTGPFAFGPEREAPRRPPDEG